MKPRTGFWPFRWLRMKDCLRTEKHLHSLKNNSHQILNCQLYLGKLWRWDLNLNALRLFCRDLFHLQEESRLQKILSTHCWEKMKFRLVQGKQLRQLPFWSPIVGCLLDSQQQEERQCPPSRARRGTGRCAKSAWTGRWP